MTAPLEPPFGGCDSGNMAALIEAVPGQIERALAASAPWPLQIPSPALLAVGALGGSAMAADLSTALHSDRLPRPILTVRDDRWPACVDDASLALLSSYSGGTAETLALYREAGRRGITRVAMTTGGASATACRSRGSPPGCRRARRFTPRG